MKMMQQTAVYEDYHRNKNKKNNFDFKINALIYLITITITKAMKVFEHQMKPPLKI